MINHFTFQAMYIRFTIYTFTRPTSTGQHDDRVHPSPGLVYDPGHGDLQVDTQVTDDEAILLFVLFTDRNYHPPTNPVPHRNRRFSWNKSDQVWSILFRHILPLSKTNIHKTCEKL